MLPPAARLRLLRDLPGSYRMQIPTDNGPRTWNEVFETRWAGDERDPAYPLCVLSHGPCGVLREQEQPLDGLFERRSSPDPTVAIERVLGRRLYDELTVTLATQGYHTPTGTAASERAYTFAYGVYNWFIAEFDHSEPGPNRNEIPVVLRQTGIGPVRDVSDLVDDESVSRYQFTLQLYYTLAYLDEVESVAGFDLVTDEVSLPNDPAASDAANRIKRVEVRYTPESEAAVTAATVEVSG